MVHTKTYIFRYFCEEYLVLLTMVPRNSGLSGLRILQLYIIVAEFFTAAVSCSARGSFFTPQPSSQPVRMSPIHRESGHGELPAPTM